MRQLTLLALVAVANACSGCTTSREHLARCGVDEPGWVEMRNPPPDAPELRARASFAIKPPIENWFRNARGETLLCQRPAPDLWEERKIGKGCGAVTWVFSASGSSASEPRFDWVMCHT